MEAPRTKNLALLEPHLTHELLNGVREFWFEHLETDEARIRPGMEHNKRWFMSGKELDDICVKKFAPTLEAIRAAGATTGHDVISVAQPRRPLDWLSLVILLDQIPRNCYRDGASRVVFQVFDPIALQVAMTALEQGIPDQVPELRWQLAYRNWFYLPLMHSEAAVFHDKAVEEYAAMVDDVAGLAATPSADDANDYQRRARAAVQRDPEAAKQFVQMSLDFERRHQAIIQRFGRYPHRNKALGREMTAEEAEYLANGGDTFGS